MSPENKYDAGVSRRAFLAAGVVSGAAAYALRRLPELGGARSPKASIAHSLKEHLVVVHGDATDEDEPRVVRQMALAAIDELGGMSALVSKGDRVLIKPNMAFDRRHPFAANTNPWLVGAVVEMCVAAGAGRVRVMDHPFARDHLPPYRNSGIMDAASEAGAEVVFVDKTRFVEVPIPDGVGIKSWPMLKDVYYQDETDVLINMPIAKHHSRSRLTMATKNVMGMAGGERGALHVDIHNKLVDLNRAVKIDLIILDAYRTLRRHGPTGGRLADVDNSKEQSRRIVACTDFVSVDAYGATLFGLEPEELGYVKIAHESGMGRMDWSQRSVKEISV